MKFFNIYQYVTPLIVLPLSYYLWLRRLDGNHWLVLFTLSMPILSAYVIPGVGTNWLKLWEFNIRLKLGNFRPHHGFVFGSAISLLTLLCVDAPPLDPGLGAVLRTGFITGSTLAFWNWLYDIRAIKVGFITMYNRQHYEGQGPEAIATDYAPVFFFTFGLCYGIALHVGQYCVLELQRWDSFAWLLIISNLVILTLPVSAFVIHSYLKNGYLGLRPFPQDYYQQDTLPKTVTGE
jgi:hypothetical protein